MYQGMIFIPRLLAEYSAEEQKLRELSEKVLRNHGKSPSQWIVQVDVVPSSCSFHGDHIRGKNLLIFLFLSSFLFTTNQDLYSLTL